MMIAITEESELKEFVINRSSETARVGRKGIIFKLSTETLLLTLASDEVNFLDFVNAKFLINSIQKDSNKFSDSITKVREDKNTSVFRFGQQNISKYQIIIIRLARGRKTRVRASISNFTVISANNRT